MQNCFYIIIDIPWINWKIYFSQKIEVPSCSLSQNLWYNQYIQADMETVPLFKFF